MFKLKYRIVISDYDEFIGQHGFFQIECNGAKYGEMYSKEIEAVMDKVSLHDWFERIVKVIQNLSVKEYVLLNDVESYNTWIEFEKRNEDILISVVKAEKQQGVRDIEFQIKGKKTEEWERQVVNFQQLKEEVIEKGKEYIQNIETANTENIWGEKLKKLLNEIE